MRSASQRFLVVGFALVFAAPLARGQDASYSFTSLIDNIDWPRAQRSKQTATGLAGDQFLTPEKVAFNNFTGNLAFFDANNLTTRPSSLINGAAWWTDVKSRSYTGAGGQTFETTTMSIDFFNNTPDRFVTEFGLDIAIAAIGGGGAPASIIVDAFDNLGYRTFHSLSFTSTANPFTQLIGTYTSLNVPNSGREARFWFTASSLLNNPAAFTDPRYDPSHYGVQAMNFSLKPLATLGSTTQIAFDNFILGSGAQPNSITEPLTYHNPIPIGANTPYTFVYDDATAGANETVVDPDSYDIEDVLQAHLAVLSPTDVRNLVATSSVTTTTDIYTQAAHALDLITYEMEVTLEAAGVPILRVEVQAEPGGFVEQAISTTTALQNAIDDAVKSHDFETAARLMDQQSQIFDSMSDALEVYNDTFMTNMQSLRLFAFGAPMEEVDPDYYFNFSFEDYMAYKELLEEEWVVGDSGAIVAPFLGTNGEILTYLVTTWIVTDSGGTFSLGLASVPEPASAMTLLVAAALILNPRRRHRSQTVKAGRHMQRHV